MIQKDPIPPFKHAYEALKKGDDETVEDAVFALKYYDGEYIARVISAVKELLKRSDLTPQQIISIGRVLHGLNRMPLRTPGLDIHVALVTKNGGEAESYDLYLSDDRFATDSGGYVDFGQGSDSFSGPMFEVEPGYRGVEGWRFGSLEWPDAFSEMSGAELQIEDDSDGNLLDLEHSDGSEFWDWIYKHA